MSQDDYAKRALSAGDEYANNLAYYRTTAATDFLAGVQWARENPAPEVTELVVALEELADICEFTDQDDLIFHKPAENMIHVIEHAAYAKAVARAEAADRRLAEYEHECETIREMKAKLATVERTLKDTDHWLSIKLDEIKYLDQERDSLRQSLKVAREALEGIEMCLGFAPDHCGESFKFALKVIEDLRQSARDALTKLEAV